MKKWKIEKGKIEMETKKTKFEVREIEAWMDLDGWTYNDSRKIAVFNTAAAGEKRAFLNTLHKLGIVCKRGMCVVINDGYCYELQNRKTGEPLFAAIPMDF